MFHFNNMPQTKLSSGQTIFVVTDSEGRIIDKDGYDPIPVASLTLSDVEDYVYFDKEEAEGYVEHADPVGEADLSVFDIQSEFTLLLP